MTEPARSRSPAVRRAEVEVAAAVAREAVIELHVARALELVALGTGRVSALRMLEIYVRLLSLTGTAREAVINRVLARFGDDDSAASAIALFEDEEGPSVWRSLRRRLRGRVHDELRHAVELHTGVTHRALLDLHVTHARRFVRLLSDPLRMNEACTLYVDMAGVPAALRPVLYPLMLAALADEAPAPQVTPVPAAAAPVAAPAALRPRWSAAPGLAR
jgi:hypothetical protein